MLAKNLTSFGGYQTRVLHCKGTKGTLRVQGLAFSVQRLALEFREVLNLLRNPLSSADKYGDFFSLEATG